MPDKTILVVESEGEVARAISAALGRFDVGVEVVEDGKKMFSSAKSRPPALIVLRVELPGQSGYSICMKLRKEKELKDIPLILTSSEANEDTFESHRKLKVRADDYQILRSPVPTEELVEKIRALVPLEPAGDDLDVITLEDDEAITIEDEDAFSADELEDLTVGDDDGGVGDSTMVMTSPLAEGGDEELPSLDDVLENIDLAGTDAEPVARQVSESPVEGEDLASLDDVLESLDDAAEVEVGEPTRESSAEDLENLLGEAVASGREEGVRPAALSEPAGGDDEDLLAGLELDGDGPAAPAAPATGDDDLDIDQLMREAEEAAGLGAVTADPEPDALLAGLEETPARPPAPPPGPSPSAVSPAPEPERKPEVVVETRTVFETRTVPDPVVVTKLQNAEQENELLREKVQKLEARIEEIHQSFEKRESELGSLRTKTSSKDKEFLALKTTINQKDRDILELKEELNRKDQEILEAQEKVGESEQEMARQQEMLAARDRELKEQAERHDVLLRQKHEIEELHQAKMSEWEIKYDRDTTDLGQQLKQAAEERARLESAAVREREVIEQRLRALQTEFDETKQRHGDEVFGLRARFKGQVDALEGKIRGLQDDLENTRRELEDERASHETTREEASRIPGLESELGAVRDEIAELQKRVADLGADVADREERIMRAYEKIKADEKVKQKARQAVEIAFSLLTDQIDEDIVIDEAE